MLPWIQLGAAKVPGSGEEMALYQRGTEFSIRVGNYDLMSSREHGSEDALASAACERLADPSSARILVGGLGMGFTLAAALRCVGKKGEVVVAELVPEVVAWNRAFLSGVAEHPLRDPRTTVREMDVARVIRSEPGGFNAILLDVDNGPRALTSANNGWLYTSAGLRAITTALRPRGILAVWSSGADPAFTKRLKQEGFATEEKRISSRGSKGARYLVWLAQRG